MAYLTAEDTALQHVALFDVLNRLAEDPSKPAGGIAKLFPVVSTVGGWFC